MLTEQVRLDITTAQRQIDDLEAELRRLSQPIRIPIEVSGENALDGLRRDVTGADSGLESLNNELEETERELRRVDRAADDSTDAILRVGTRGASAFTSLRGSIIGVSAAFAAIAGARAFIGFANESIQAASAMAESTSKANVVFGDFFADIDAFASTAPQALGLANQQALEFTATFGNLFTALGLSQQAAAELSPEIVQLGADLASFNNLDVADALEKLRSGLVGEIEPLRSLGVSFNAADVEAKAFELGLVGVNGAIDEAAKVQARYALIMEQTTNAQGDFARTADGIANRQRTLSAEFQNLQVAIGEALLPAFEALVEQGPALIEGFEKSIPAIQGFAQALATTDFASFISGVVDVSRALLNIPAIIGGFDAGFFNENQANAALVLSDRTQELVEALRKGVDPAKALANAIASIPRDRLPGEEFADIVNQLIAMTGLDPGRLSDLSRHFAEQGEAAGFDAEQVRAVREEIARLLADSAVSPAALPGADPDDPATISASAQAIRDLAAAAQPLTEFEPDFDVNFADAAETFGRVAESLSTAFSDALADEEGEIEDDAKSFVDRVIADIEAQASFQANLSRLREAGGVLTAGFLEGIGPEEAAGLLADFLENPTEIARAEAAAQGMGAAAAMSQYAAFREVIQSVDFSDIPVTGGITVPIILGPLPALSAITAGQVQGGQVTTNITNNWNTLPSPSVASDQINQSVGRINQNIRGGPQ